MNITHQKLGERGYPECLKHISGPPAQLHWAGRPWDELLTRPRLAVVGSRKLSAYGRQVTSELVKALVSYDVVIVSGLALGIDAVAHQSAIDAGGTTLAVLPTSLSKIYPDHNERLARQIIEKGGALVSEYDDASPFMYKYNFIARNRIISGLSDAVLITEAAVDSGSLHTAEFALQQGIEVLVVPSNITSPTSVGTNNLLKVGATPVIHANDILRALKISEKLLLPKKPGGSAAEQCILDLIAEDCHDGEQLLSRSGLSTREFNQALTLLEINGQISGAGCNTWY